ncbi:MULTISPECIES: type II toxin-antitoxin system RelE/ParE family toxin [unclassified Pseudomonas]|jgi:plasmid stabilization system protein ParE|uniref:type II toxin-antitoxin system RelE/ParE family toxin n=1 Tax=unclassified Pseudomonas TaxID=196821 RepID=UPI00119C633C|nr:MULTISPECIES: type II toxin-antitoxin system RelE/ParE family toxin [unclassified Pseudomonas]TWC14853.1 ParE-like toxin of type II ParDE toxin-antitoxin system [Pseudomonas sp. SJZ075]TWC24258.1 ParE-like toxin of type II ParDE toxin-antitoxin system [Pseudomonas sp. SJZ074]TWC31229.1 ParE-like toxin of type II ParDE toxin-antitoxin system [Pseudomonas sp. SJZ078]TWC41997.1 ParE-like toxin of type II ParDE toxin-antitoxin system [Pseudomonas sp. SJZ085]TWC52147.1 ParE-like toxin of type II
MSLKIVILQSAETDLKELRTYLIERFSVQTWQSTHTSLKVAIRHLATLPYAGSIPDEIEKLNLGQYRQVLSGMNRIIYEVRGKTIYIHIIADSRKSLPALLMKRLLRGNQ